MTEGMAAGSEAAFARFYEFAFDRLYRWLLAKTRGNEELTKELVENVVLKVARCARPLRNERLLWAWLWQLARSSHIDWLRKARREPPLVALELCETAATAGAESEPDYDQELLTALEKSMSELEAEERELLKLSYFEGVPHRSIAERWQTTAKAVESKLARTREKLRRRLLEALKHYAIF